MIKDVTGLFALLAVFGLGSLFAQSGNLQGDWTGTRSERNPVNGQTFTIDYAFQFRGDGTYLQVARFGTLTILQLEGTYSIQPGQMPGNPSYTHVLSLNPTKILTEPARDELRLRKPAPAPASDG